MFARMGTLRFTISVLVLGLVIHAANTPPAGAGGAAGPQVFRTDQLTKQQFKALPDSAVIESQGQRMTKAQIRALAAQKGQAMQAKIQAAARQAQAQFEQRRVQFEQQQQAKLAADNAKAMEYFKRLP